MIRINYLFILGIFLVPIFLKGQSVADTLSFNPGYTDQVWYSLAEDEQARSALTDWDIAFSIEGFAASIMVNDAKGMEVYVYPSGDTANWATVDTAGMGSWIPYHNSDTSWARGAFNVGKEALNDFDLGWGIYNVVTHHVTGDSLFVVKMADGSIQKLWLQSLASGTYSFRHGNLEGTMDMSHTLSKATFSGKNFGYYNLSQHEIKDLEPVNTDWDLLFSKYIGFLNVGGPALVPYCVTGVLSNTGVEVAQVGSLAEPQTFTNYEGETFSHYKDVIGYDWKSFDFTTGWMLDDSLAYIVKARDGQIWRLVFTDFGGSTTGEFFFEKEALSTTSIRFEADENQFAVYPNPSTGQTLNLVADIERNLPIQLHILDLRGRAMGSHTFQPLAGLHTYSVDNLNLKTGVYLLRIQQGDAHQTVRLWVN